MTGLITSLRLLQSRISGSVVLKEFPDLIFVLDQEGRFLDLFAADEKLLTAPVNSIIGNRLIELFPADLAEIVMKNLRKELKSGEGTVFGYTLPIDGVLHHFQAKLIRDSAENVTAFIRDITEIRLIQIKEAEHNRIIQENEKRFRLLADHLPGAVYLCNNDPDFSMLYLNDKVFDITGYEPEKFISKEINFPDIYHPDDAAGIYKLVDESLEKKKSFHLEYRVRHKSGAIKWIEEFGTGVYDNEGELICLEGYLQDITIRKENEQKIIQQNEALIKANDELDRFVYSASHDLRSPLSSLLGLVNLAEATNAIDESKLLLEKMKDCVSNLDHFIREITYYSQNSRLEVEMKNVVLVDVVHLCLADLRHAPEAKDVNFEFDIPKGQQIKTDDRRLKIVLNNLIGNAIKYSDGRKSVKWVRVSFAEKNGKNEIVVSDNGLGIPCEVHSRIFEMFFRASEKSNGSGLGLYIAKETVDKLGGTIEFTSSLGHGSVFKVCLPK